MAPHHTFHPHTRWHPGSGQYVLRHFLETARHSKPQTSRTTRTNVRLLPRWPVDSDIREIRRYPVQIKEVPEQLKQAFLATEDARFYEHSGIDYKGIARAIWLLATTNEKRVPGGSTITQQVARQFFLNSEYSYKRKLAEILLARKIESQLKKDEILELYLNKSFSETVPTASLLQPSFTTARN